MKKRAGSIPAIIIILVLLGSCTNIMSPPGDRETVPGGKGRLTIHVEDNARTALPSVAFDKYILRFAYTGGSEGYTHNQTEWSPGLSVDLEPGDWTVYVDAYTGTVPAGQGSTAVTVSAEIVTPVTIRVGVNPGAGVQGTLKYKVSYPTTGHTYGTQVLSVRDTAGVIVGSSAAITNGVEGSVSLDPGMYFVGVVINDTVQQTGAARTTAVHIYGGKETSLVLNIEEGEFTAIVPLAVTAALTVPAGITVSSRAIAAYGDAACTVPLGTANTTALTGQAEITLWVPSATASVYMRQEIMVNGTVPLNAKAELVTITDPGHSVDKSLDDTLYTISLDAGIPGGTVAVTNAVSAAFEGNSVGVAVTPGDSWGLKTGSLKYNDGITDTPLSGAGPAYTFVMPGAGVTVKAEFHRFAWYVTAGSIGPGDGSEAAPYATMDDALSGIATAYEDLSWPNRGTLTATPVHIVVSGTVTEAIGDVDSMVVIKDTGSNLYDNYPPIVLEGTGTLDASLTPRRVLYIENAVVTLCGDLTLTGGNITGFGGGVHLAAGEFTMEGGTISGNEASTGGGGGVYVATGDFTLKGEGTITDNKAPGIGSTGGGVYMAFGAGDFIMSGGIISNNEAYRNGGGVYFAAGTFTMEGGTISYNKATYEDGYGGGASGGGVIFYGTTFDMTGGTISYNTTFEKGGGVRVAGGSFDMSGNARVANNQSLEGGGVQVGNMSGETFTMSGNAVVENNKTIGTYNSGGGVHVSSNGIFIMDGGTISGNEATGANKGGGVYLGGGSFTMNGGTIGGNVATSNGGGVYVDGYGTFNMSDGTIDDNEATGDGGGVYVGWSSGSPGTFNMNSNAAVSGNNATKGGGVFVGGGYFSMNEDAVVSDNNAANGGGLYFESGTFDMSSSSTADIRDNTATGNGGGVYVESGSFDWGRSYVVSVISGNNATNGGGVYVAGGAFYLNGDGAISDNTATGNGGGVYVAGGDSGMTQTSVISGNEAASGGGVYVATGDFTKSGGTIYGDTDNTPNNGSPDDNTAKTGKGHAVWVVNGSKKRNSTANSGDALDSQTSGTSGGWESSSPSSSSYIQSMIDSAAEGGTIVLISGDYDMDTQLEIDKAITINIGTSNETVVFKRHSSFTGDMIKITGGGSLTLQASGLNSSLTLDGMNVSDAGGSLVRVEGGNLTMNARVTLQNNKNPGSGGGVYVTTGSFVMNDGTISNNQAWEGGGVYVNSGTFTMSEGTISSNFANTNGGGVYVGDGTFTKTGGIIHGWDPADSLRNDIGDGEGGAVYVSDGKKRNSTAGAGDDLDSSVDGSAGGWD